MTRKQAIKKTLFKFTWIKDHLKRNRRGGGEIYAFIIENSAYSIYVAQCPLCDLFCVGSWNNPNCPKCILNTDNCHKEYGSFQKFMKEKSIPKKRKYCEWVIKQCKKALEEE
jgi:hypothetical protein